MKMDAAAWNLMFLVVYVVAVAVDPLFFYLPVIEDNPSNATKCITTDKTLKIIAICVRSFLDLVTIGDLVRQISKRIRLEASEYVINILGILPVPQVLVPIIVSGMSGSKSRKIRKFLNAVVILQYVPRILRVWILWNKAVNDAMNNQPKTESSRPTDEDNEKEKKKEKKRKKEKKMKKEKKKYMVLKAGLNLYLYLIASHVLGAFWYFFSIERETKCWHLACHEHNITCNNSTFHCDNDFRINHPIINESCSLKDPNTNLFDFGIYQKARQSGILDSMDIPQKTLFCFWWGLRNLSSFGQNLETSPDYWENCFTILISIFGLLLFLYFIGNLQVYMQSEASEWLQRYKQRSYHGI
ncbi:hypothetical protein F2P56_034940, partial [Juglans regia]